MLQNPRRDPHHRPSSRGSLPRGILSQGLILALPVLLVAGTLAFVDHPDAEATAGRAARLVVPILLGLFALRRIFRRLEIRAVGGHHPPEVQLTGLGWSVAAISSLLLVVDLVAEQGTMTVPAVAGFAALDLAMVAAGWAAWRFEATRRPGTSGPAVPAWTPQARFEPARVTVGEATTLRWRLPREPVAPAGFTLTLELSPPEALAEDDRPGLRLALGSEPGDEDPYQQVTGSRRGLHGLAAPTAQLRDFLGLTRRRVLFPRPPERLEVLPTVPKGTAVELSPRAATARDLLARAHRRPDQDLFHFREYTSGDDTRRIHWRHSLKHGRLILRQPESRETSRRVALVLDTYLWPGSGSSLGRQLEHQLDLQLDRLVGAWLAVGRHLAESRNRTELYAALAVDAAGRPRPGLVGGALADGNLLEARRLGAAAAWQRHTDLDQVLSQLRDRGVHEVVVFSARLSPWPQLWQGASGVPGAGAPAAGGVQVAFLPWQEPGLPVAPLAPGRRGSRPSWLHRVFLLPSPVGSPTNSLPRRARAWVAGRRQTAAALPTNPISPGLLSLQRRREIPSGGYEIVLGSSSGTESSERIALRPLGGVQGAAA